jgi:hypothetical protein
MPIVRGLFQDLLGFNKDRCSPSRHWFASHWPFKLVIKHKLEWVGIRAYWNEETRRHAAERYNQLFNSPFSTKTYDDGISEQASEEDPEC